MRELTTPADQADLLKHSPNIAVLGAHPDAARAAHYVPAYLAAQGYTLHPVNPTRTGQRLWGQPIVARLPDIPAPVELVLVFRRSDALPGHLDEIREMDPPPRAVWLQQGIRSQPFTDALVAAGITVVQDRCALVVHRQWRLGPVRPHT